MNFWMPFGGSLSFLPFFPFFSIFLFFLLDLYLLFIVFFSVYFLDGPRLLPYVRDPQSDLLGTQSGVLNQALDNGDGQRASVAELLS